MGLDAPRPLPSLPTDIVRRVLGHLDDETLFEVASAAKALRALCEGRDVLAGRLDFYAAHARDTPPRPTSLTHLQHTRFVHGLYAKGDVTIRRHPANTLAKIGACIGSPNTVVIGDGLYALHSPSEYTAFVSQDGRWATYQAFLYRGKPTVRVRRGPAHPQPWTHDDTVLFSCGATLALTCPITSCLQHFSADGSRFAVSHTSGIRVFATGDTFELLSLCDPIASSTAAAFKHIDLSRDGRWLLSHRSILGMASAHVGVFDTADGRRVADFGVRPTYAPGVGGAFSAGGAYLALRTHDALEIFRWQHSTAAPHIVYAPALGLFQKHFRIRSWAFSPVSDVLAILMGSTTAPDARIECVALHEGSNRRAQLLCGLNVSTSNSTLTWGSSGTTLMFMDEAWMAGDPTVMTFGASKSPSLDFPQPARSPRAYTDSPLFQLLSLG